MFTLGVSDHVMIAHSFADPFFGPAQRLHGATFAVDLEVRAPELGPHHVVMDIGRLRAILRGVLAEIDYRNLDEHAAFSRQFSTSERVAEWVAVRAAAELAQHVPQGASVRVVVRESPVAYAAYERGV
jgi:6-pyruvoyltetrahydropterin/6-carboxytetrahydropterin synthase